MAKYKALIVEDDASLMAVMTHYLEKNSFEVLSFEIAADAVQRMAALEFDVALVDMNLGNLSGHDILKSIKENHPLVEVIIMTAFSNINDAVQTIKDGAYDYLSKPIKEADLILHLNNALKKRELSIENRVLKDKLSRYESPPILVGSSPAMRTLKETISNVAPNEVSILIQGESGTGKELVARSIHRLSNRKNGPFVAINCAALPENLMESELFGHVKGAFTGAIQDHVGKLKYAQGGTVFLDEVSELPLALQAKLLRAVQEREVTPVGSNKTESIDIRIISASNKDLQNEVNNKLFRQDLFYRLNIYPIVIPPLRERSGDIPLLLEYLMPNIHIDKDALVMMEAYHWPGNVRELENGLQFAKINANDSIIEKKHLPPAWLNADNEVNTPPANIANQDSSNKMPTLAELERKIIIDTLQKVKGNQSQCARILDITRSQLVYRMKKMGIVTSKIIK